MSVVENLERQFGDFKLLIPRWEIADEGITALWGPSGSGKTSVFRVLIGLESCPGCRWIFQGEDLCARPVPERRLGVVFQNYELFPHLSARANIEFALKARGQKSNGRAEFLIDRLGLKACADRTAQVLSGGEKQRVALARALAAKPRFLFLDEPFSALDEDLRGEARDLVREVLREEKIPALLITHDERDLRSLGVVQVQKIKKGQLVAEA